MISKIIYYGWFGGKDLPGLEQKCISMWQKILPDYQLHFNQIIWLVLAISYCYKILDNKFMIVYK